MRGRGSGIGPVIGAGGVVGVPLGLWALGPVGGLIVFVVWCVSLVAVRLGTAWLTQRTAHGLGPAALAAGGEIDVTCDCFEVHLRSQGTGSSGSEKPELES